MAFIDCADYVEDDNVPVIPSRIDRTNPDAIANRWANFTYSMDLSPEAGDEQLGNVQGAWSVSDLPVTHAAQIDDDRGDDLIVVAIVDRLYYLDWKRYEDEWNWNVFRSIRRMVRLGPIPTSKEDTTSMAEDEADVYAPARLKRIREVQWQNNQPPNTNVAGKWTVTASEWGNEAATARSKQMKSGQRMRAKIAVKGGSFIVTLEHRANEPIEVEYWQVLWDLLGRRIPQSRQT